MPTPFLASDTTYHRRRKALIAVLLAAAGWAAMRWRPFRVEVSGPSMAPRLLPGDWALATAPRRLRRGDVVVVRHPNRAGMEMVKRITAGPGDDVAGRVLHNDEWFVAGDNAEWSTDSRSFGPVPQATIVGRVRYIYWPPGRAGRIRRLVMERPE
jgi:nickel-type superoxide dismutase maturation protease